MILPLLHLLLATATAEYSDNFQYQRARRDVSVAGAPRRKVGGLPLSAGPPQSANAPQSPDEPQSPGSPAVSVRRSADSFSFGSQGNNCQSPNSCISLTSCNAFASRATDRSPENAEFLRKATCGFQGSTPLVCCPPATSVNRDSKPTPPPPATSQNEECGQGSFAVVRVVGGSPATAGDWPWAVAIYVDDHFSCGGTLINHNFVLTAAHCVISASHGGNQIPTESYKIRLGDLDLERDDDGGTPITLKLIKAVPHPNFRLSNFHNDIAVMQLERPVQYNDFIRPACLPSKAEVNVSFARMGAILVGWGTTGFEKAASSHLQYVPLPIQPIDKCEKAYAAYKATHPIIPTQLCAGLLTGRKDACQGDSGGPLTVMDPNLPGAPWTLIGVVSYGFKCAEVGFPGIYTRVTAFLDWIEENTKL